MNSMTGFGSKEMAIASVGKISLEIRSTNHKFLETVLHLPPGFLSLEDKIKKELEARLKRGRLVCVMNITDGPGNHISINKSLVKHYVAALKNIQSDYRLQDEIRLDTLIHLPGVLSLTETKTAKAQVWPCLKILVRKTLDELVRMRQKEGGALYNYLKSRAILLEKILGLIKIRFKKIIKEKVARFKTEDERASFLKDTDITEELERLEFHIRNFQKRLSIAGPIGKELDFIAQEMQREANTMGAKSCDAGVSAQVIQSKSQIEKIREQVQNVE